MLVIMTGSARRLRESRDERCIEQANLISYLQERGRCRREGGLIDADGKRA